MTHVGAHAQLGTARRAEQELQLRTSQELLLGMDQQAVGADVADRRVNRRPLITRHMDGALGTDHDRQPQPAALAAGVLTVPVGHELGAVGDERGNDTRHQRPEGRGDAEEGKRRGRDQERHQCAKTQGATKGTLDGVLERGQDGQASQRDDVAVRQDAEERGHRCRREGDDQHAGATSRDAQ